MRGKGLCLGCNSAEKPFMGSHVSFIFPDAKSLPYRDPRHTTWHPLQLISPALCMLKEMAAYCSFPLCASRQGINWMHEGMAQGLALLECTDWHCRWAWASVCGMALPLHIQHASEVTEQSPQHLNHRWGGIPGALASPRLSHEQTMWNTGVQVTLAWGRQHVGIVMQPRLLRTCACGIECLLSYTWVNKPFLSENKHLQLVLSTLLRSHSSAGCYW